jgi:hypothetical protein
MKFQQQQQQTHSDSSKMNILLILRKSENKRSISAADFSRIQGLRDSGFQQDFRISAGFQMAEKLQLEIPYSTAGFQDSGFDQLVVRLILLRFTVFFHLGPEVRE